MKLVVMVRNVENVIGAFRTEIENLNYLIDQIEPDEWNLPSGCDGWSVKDLIAHMESGFAIGLSDPDRPKLPPEEPGENIFDRMVRARRDWTPEQTVASYRRLAPKMLEMSAMVADPGLAATPIELPVGTVPMGLLPNSQVCDHYSHLRFDLIRPRGPLAVDIPENVPAIEAAVEWLRTLMPQAGPNTLRPALGRPLAFELTGPGGQAFTLRQLESGLETVDGVGDDAAAVVSSDARDFISWSEKRTAWREATTITGDEEYAARILDAMHLTDTVQ